MVGSWWSGSSVMVCAVFGTSDDVLTLLPLSLSGRSAGRGWGGRGGRRPTEVLPSVTPFWKCPHSLTQRRSLS